MVNKTIKRIASKLPVRFQQELKRVFFSWQIRNNKFLTNEKEYALLDSWVSEGDWVLDIGANIGHYTTRLSELAGHQGRVIAFEPVPETFELLASNVAQLKKENVTLLNVGVSESTQLLGIDIPKFDTGLDNYYMAHLTTSSTALQVLCIPVDTLALSNPIKLVKIDAEGHDLAVLNGMKKLLNRDHPILIIEEDTPEIKTFLSGFGYNAERIENSHNQVFRANS